MGAATKMKRNKWKKVLLISLLSLSMMPAFAMEEVDEVSFISESSESDADSQSVDQTPSNPKTLSFRIKTCFSNNKKILNYLVMLIFQGALWLMA